MNRPKGLKYNIVKENKGWFKKGSEPFNKGQKFVHSGSFKVGHPYFGNEETQFKKTGITFQGSKSEYKTLHLWVYKNLGRPEICVSCERTRKEIRIEWANKSREYKKEVNDWISLCVKCHRAYDRFDKEVKCSSN